MAVSPGHNEVCILLLRQANKLMGVGFGHVNAHMRLACCAVRLQVSGNIADSPLRQILLTGRANLDDCYFLSNGNAS